MKRTCFAFKKGIENRKILRSKLKANSIVSLNQLKNRLIHGGYKVVLLDFDGVLAPHGQSQPVCESLQALKNLQLSTEISFYVLSNKPTVERKQFFEENFKNIKFIVCKRKKPYPDSIVEVIENEKVLPEQVAIVDDRLLTGLLAAELAGADFFFLSKPLTDYRGSPFTEIFFSVMRRLERVILLIP